MQSTTFNPKQPRLLERVRRAIQARHYSRRTEKAYTGWFRRYVFFHHKRHPAEMCEIELTAFLSHLATERKVNASRIWISTAGRFAFVTAKGERIARHYCLSN